MSCAQAGPPGISPFGSGLAAMKVKHRLQALHQAGNSKKTVMIESYCNTYDWTCHNYCNCIVWFLVALGSAPGSEEETSTA